MNTIVQVGLWDLRAGSQGTSRSDFSDKGVREELLQEGSQHADHLGWVAHSFDRHLPSPEWLEQGLGQRTARRGPLDPSHGLLNGLG